jgi:hypothetical protein
MCIFLEAEMRDLRLWVIGILTLALGGCDAIGAIFRVGVWAGVLMVVVVVAVLAFLFSRFR